MEEALKRILDEGETVQWAGRAEPFQTMDKTTRPIFVCGVVTALAIFIAVTAVYRFIIARTGAPFQWVLALALLLVLLVKPMYILLDAGKVRKMHYVATDRRLMVVSGGEGRWVDYKRIDRAAFKGDDDGHISLLCGDRALRAKAGKRREIAAIGMVGGDRSGEDHPIESFGFYGLDQESAAALRSVLESRCPAALTAGENE
ncbi:MAG: hypothetical protein E7426_03690 [Ruminococcaceae bacterium]|nr:hypothetical protein [Oscillospiraceae bacterium]